MNTTARNVRLGDEVIVKGTNLGTVLRARSVRLDGRPGIEFVLAGPGGGEMLWAAKPGRRVQVRRPSPFEVI